MGQTARLEWHNLESLGSKQQAGGKQAFGEYVDREKTSVVFCGVSVS